MVRIRFLAQLVRAGGLTVGTCAVLLGGFWSSYMATISIGARRRPPGPPSTETAVVRRPFHIVIPAHDEEPTITRALKSLANLNYQQDLVEVHVLADNCTDRTAEIARDLGATVHERHEPDNPGKGMALGWLLDRFPYDESDVFVFLDADCEADPQMLVELDRSLSSGAPAAQAHIKIEGDRDGGVVGLRAAAFAVRNYLRPFGRTGLGGSSFLFGTGMAITAPSLRCNRWSNELAEDLDLSVRMLFDGGEIVFADRAEVSTSMPTRLVDSMSQHERWEAGRRRLALRSIPKLLAAAARRRHGRRWIYLDAATDLSMPALSIHVLSIGSGAVLSALFGRGLIRRVLVAGAVASGATIVVHVLHALRLTGAPAAVYRSLARAPINIVWQVRVTLRTLRRRPDRWVRTPRDSAGEST